MQPYFNPTRRNMKKDFDVVFHLPKDEVIFHLKICKKN
jgi:hypothetical protein